MSISFAVAEFAKETGNTQVLVYPTKQYEEMQALIKAESPDLYKKLQDLNHVVLPIDIEFFDE